jgi:hypothetical protein
MPTEISEKTLEQIGARVKESMNDFMEKDFGRSLDRLHHVDGAADCSTAESNFNSAPLFLNYSAGRGGSIELLPFL